MRKDFSRVILENYYEPCILYLLSVQPSYGYKLQNDLKTKLQCHVNIGNLYRCLSKLYKNHDVFKYHEKSEEGPDRVMYKITKEGEVHLQSWIENLKIEKKIINKLINRYTKQS